MAKPKADLVQTGAPEDVREVTLHLNSMELDHLKRLVATGFFGENVPDAAHRLLDEALAARCL